MMLVLDIIAERFGGGFGGLCGGTRWCPVGAVGVVISCFRLTTRDRTEGEPPSLITCSQ